MGGERRLALTQVQSLALEGEQLGTKTRVCANTPHPPLPISSLTLAGSETGRRQESGSRPGTRRRVFSEASAGPHSAQCLNASESTADGVVPARADLRRKGGVSDLRRKGAIPAPHGAVLTPERRPSPDQQPAVRGSCGKRERGERLIISCQTGDS